MIKYEIPLIKQGIQECVQASATQLLSYYGITKTVEQIKQEVPVYVNQQGIKLGSSLGHIATYIHDLGIQTTLHVSDIVIFDRSWQRLDNNELIAKLNERKGHVKHGWYDQDAINAIIDGYVSFLKSGGQINLPIVDSSYILKLLEKGPLYFVVSYNVLNNCAKYESGTSNQNDITGIPSTHAIVVSGYKDGVFQIVDPDFEFGGYREVSQELMIAAYYEAQTDMDNMFMSFKKIT